MSMTTLVLAGLEIAAWGMGLVFLLLAGLWGLLALLLRLDRPEPPAADPEAPPGDPAALPAALAVAIGIAVRAHRAVLRKQAAPTMRSHRPGSILFASRWVAAGRHLQTQSWHPRKR